MAETTNQVTRDSMEFGVDSAAAAYRGRLDECSRTARELARSDRQLVRIRVLVFIVALILAFVCLGEQFVSWAWMLIPGLAFAALIVIHSKLVQRLRAAQACEQFYGDAVARLTGQWKSLPETGAAFRDSTHAWSQDLDVFGPGSLFQRINQCRTLPGKRTLAEWMTTVPSAEDVLTRQRQAESLTDAIALRERLATIADCGDWESAEAVLKSWIHQPAHRIPRPVLYASGLLGAVGVVALVLVLLQVIPLTALLLILAFQAPLIYLTRDQIRSVAATVDDVELALRQLSSVAREFEQYEFQEDSLRSLQARLSAAGHIASEEIYRLSTSIRWLDNSKRNQFFAPIAWICGLLVILTDRIELWRELHGHKVGDWLHVCATLEALLSIAAFNFENPDYCLPTIHEEAREYQASQLGHPLLPRSECVRNDVSLTAERPLILISGSNMSGKSTLLRSIGSNAVLAFCGGRVNAASLTLYPFQLGTAMRVSDSLQEGKSLFFSVVQRLKAVVDLTAGSRTVLFLLDEILHGTNSHDRRRGAEAVIRTLVDRGGLGIVTTHDLALTRIVDSMDGKAVNMHFEDQVVDGRMMFDYQLRNGVVERSNAIELMRMMGLDV
jgi:hypothetical protein